MKTAGLCLLFAVIIKVSEAYRILGLFPLPAKSHMVMFESVMRRLAEKGHEVDVLSHFPQNTPIPRYNDISIRDSMPVLVRNVSISLFRSTVNKQYNSIKFITDVAGVYNCKVALNTTQAEGLKIANTTYDLVVTELFSSDCMLGFAYHFKVPVVSITTSVSLPWGSDRIGIPDNPSYIPNYLVPYSSHMSLMERLLNTLVLLAAKIGFMIATKKSNEIVREFFVPNLPYLQYLAYNTSLILVNSHLSINHARPTVPNFIEVGGLHIRPQQPLPRHFEDCLNITSQYKGVIYLSMGSVILTETLPSYILEALFEAFRELPYKVLWKVTRQNIPKDLDIPPNVYFESWMPQVDILCHSNVKLFITHGGLLGIQESVYCGVPQLGIPSFGDQELNLKTPEAMGLAIILKYDRITKESILRALKVLLEDIRYKTNAERISKLFKDRPVSPMDTAIYWIEYVIKHKGAPHLRSVGADLPWYQYFLVDVGIMFISLFIFLILVSYVAWRVMQMLFLSHRTGINLKSN